MLWIKHTDLQESKEDFPKLLDKLIPSYFTEKDIDTIEIVLNALTEPKSAKELASLASCSTRTIKDKYLDKMLIAEVVAMTIPDKPTSSNQKYKLILDKEQ